MGAGNDWPEGTGGVHSPTGPDVFPVVGIGASAGGLEALEQFFEPMPEDSGLCFVVVQHLSPDFKSLMDEILMRRTRIPVESAEDGTVIRPNRIYLMPPRKEMILSGGRLFLTDKDPSQGLALPIDRFLRSLAQDVGTRSIGVILSGTGSDGSRGIRDIHEAGGLVVAQSEESAKFAGMPRSARDTGLVDLIVPATDMGSAILSLVRRTVRPGDAGDPRIVPEVGLQAIFRMLRREYGIDFAQYKLTTVMRRVERRLLLNQVVDVEEYVRQLELNGAELNQLYKDLLIGVTQFFRDPEAFHRLGAVEIPRLLQQAQGEAEFRVWVAGCATGEEAYSLAILISEHLATIPRPIPVRIFATDAHRASLDFASAGVYGPEALSSLSPERRERFFVPRGESWQVVPPLRKMIVFAPHDLLRDAPFTRLDLITCRNLLIYLQPSAQKKIISLFHFGLRPSGTLFLGPSESPGDLHDEFESVDDHWKLYRKRRDVRLRPEMRLMLPAALPPAPRSQLPPAHVGPDRLQQAIYDRLLEEHLPPSFLINDRRELVHCFGGAGTYLRVRDGRASSNLLDLIDEELKMILVGALARVEKQGSSVVYTGIRLPEPGEPDKLLRLTVKPLSDRISGTTNYLIILDALEPPATASAAGETVIDLDNASREQVEALEQELRYTRENLQAMVEEQESSNEELQAANEELVASNEQLQSTNEELHSVNEELYTVNAEYQQKIRELTQVTADLENLFVATDVGVVILDSQLRIRRYTPRAAKVFHLLPQDVSRPLEALANPFHEPLQDLIRQVLEHGTPVEKDIRDQAGGSYFLRVVPYRVDQSVDGVVLALIDISALKTAEARLRHLSAIVESSHDAIIGKSLDGTIVSWNRGAEEMFGYPADEAIGRNARFLYPPGSREVFADTLKAVRDGGAQTAEHQRVRRDGRVIDVLYTISPILGPDGRIEGASTISRDITARNRAEQETLAAIRNRDRFLAMLSHELRNPLGAVLNAASVLEHARLAERPFAEACRVLRRQSEQMSLLLDDLLDVARITQNKLVLRKQAVFLADVLKDALEVVKPLIARRDLDLHVAGLDREVCALVDPSRMQQVVINLLKNAIKYSPDGGRISLTLSQDPGQAVISVQDTGMGITPEMLDKVFELFVQSENTLDRSEGGLGVGLTLVKSLVELHGGNVTAGSAGPGCGSEFVVRLPLASPADRPPETALSTPRDGSRARSGPLRIAVVEDNADSRETLQSLLQLEGHEVRTAATGAQGLELIVAWQPDLALVDIGLPELDGFELARRATRESPELRTRLVALTGYGSPTDRERVMASGFSAHLVKPLKLAELRRLIADPASRNGRGNPPDSS